MAFEEITPAWSRRVDLPLRRSLGAICPIASVNDGRKTQDPSALLGAQCPNRVDGCGAQSWQQAGDNRDEGKHRCNGGEPDWIEGGDSVEHLFDEPCRKIGR